jgi:hypothetical protein
MGTLGNKVVLYGGIAGIAGTYLSDTWEWDGNSWKQRMVTGPSARARMVMPALGDRLLLVGGDGLYTQGTGPDPDSGSPYLSYAPDNWEWDGNQWSSSPPMGAYAFEPGAATLGNRVVLLGEAGTLTQLSLKNNTWTWDGATWTELTVDSPTPYRAFPVVAALGTKVLMFGGWAFDPLLGVEESDVGWGDTWQWDGSYWTRLAVAGPSARGYHAMATR